MPMAVSAIFLSEADFEALSDDCLDQRSFQRSINDRRPTLHFGIAKVYVGNRGFERSGDRDQLRFANKDLVTLAVQGQSGRDSYVSARGAHVKTGNDAEAMQSSIMSLDLFAKIILLAREVFRG